MTVVESTGSHFLCCEPWSKWSQYMQGRNRKIFLRGQNHFSWFFPGVKCFFPVENFHFGWPKTNFSGFGFEKWQAKRKKKERKKKKGPLLIFVTFPLSMFHFPFTIFLLSSIFTLFPFFPCLFFPGRSAEISQSEVLGGAHYCPWWEKMGNMGSSFPGNIDMWREILEFGGKFCLFVHKNTIQIGENWACFPGNNFFFHSVLLPLPPCLLCHWVHALWNSIIWNLSFPLIWKIHVKTHNSRLTSTLKTK